MNRLGDYLAPIDCESFEKSDMPKARCEGELVHTAASGTGADAAKFTSHYAEVVAPEAGFQSGNVKLRFDGREQRDLRSERTVELPADGRLRSRDQYDVVLNGFDVFAEGKRAKAKKVKGFRLWTRADDANSGADDTIEVDVGGVLNMNCDSVECKQQSNRVRYTVDVRFLVIAHDDSVQATSRDFETNYTWNEKDELTPERVRLNAKTNTIQGARQQYDDAVLGFREINFDLGKKGRYKDHWFITWASRIREVDYQAERGRAQFDLQLFFKEWNARSKKKLTSLATKGEATLRANVAMFQFQDARVEYRHTSGKLEWRGKNRTASDDSAVWRRAYDFEW